jgi:hypothetical protein
MGFHKHIQSQATPQHLSHVRTENHVVVNSILQAIGCVLKLSYHRVDLVLQMAVVKTAPIERRVNDGAEPIRVRFQTADYLFRRPRRPQLLSSCHGGVHDDQRKSKGAH